MASANSAITKKIKNVCEALGRNNKPTYVVMAVATAKGIFRPLFTLMDKKESPETKKYTALREGMTELIAIPTYWACGELAAKGAKLVKDPKLAEQAKHNLMFVGVCTAALIVIPGLCSCIVKPFTDKIFKKKGIKDEPARLDVTSKTPGDDKVPFSNANQSQKSITPPAYKNYDLASFTNHGMRVG